MITMLGEVTKAEKAAVTPVIAVIGEVRFRPWRTGCELVYRKLVLFCLGVVP